MKKTKFWMCRECGVVLEEVADCSKGAPVCVPECCGKAMEAVPENTKDTGAEKHVPVVKEENGKLKVVVGSVPHPMTPDHHILWIEVLTPDGHVCRRYLDPASPPETELCTKPPEGSVIREFCNIHGLWSAEVGKCGCHCSAKS